MLPRVDRPRRDMSTGFAANVQLRLIANCKNVTMYVVESELPTSNELVGLGLIDLMATCTGLAIPGRCHVLTD